MSNTSDAIKSALEKAKMVAAKITGQLPDGMPTKRSADSSDDQSSKKFASVNDAIGAQLAMLKQQVPLNGQSSEEIRVPDKLVGLVIGKGGDQIHRLQAETQCKVIIAPDSNGQPDRILTLVGHKEHIDHAKRAIDEILKRSGNASGLDSYGRSNIEVFEIRIPGNKCGLIIGKGGETIKRLSEQYGVKLVVVQDTNEPSNVDKPLRITGDKDKVAKAKEAVLDLLNPKEYEGGRERGGGHRDGHRDGNRGYSNNEYGSDNGGGGGGGGRRGGYSNGNQPEAFIKVPGEKAGIVIGKGGESIKDINQRSGAYVQIDKNQRQSENGDKMFVIRGTQEQIAYAQQLIYEKITGAQGSPPRNFFNPDEESSNGGYGASAQQAAYAQAWPQWQQQQQQQQQQAASDPKAAGADNMYAWNAYYQQLYGSQMAGGAQPAAVGGGAAASAAGQAVSGTPAASASTHQPSINPSTGQPDYSQAWIDYYRSLNMHSEAEAILKQQQASAAAAAGGGAANSAGAQTAGAQAAQNGGSNPAAYGGGQAANANAAWSAYGYQNYQANSYYKQEAGNGQ